VTPTKRHIDFLIRTLKSKEDAELRTSDLPLGNIRFLYKGRAEAFADAAALAHQVLIDGALVDEEREKRIRAVLETCSSYCLDNEEERNKVVRALMSATRTSAED
jgi:hypothetical protein